MGVYVYGFDIETDTSIDGFDPARSKICAASVVTPWDNHTMLGPEFRIIAEVESMIAALPPGVICTWNGNGFDLPFWKFRCELLGAPTTLRFHSATKPTIWGHHGHLDAHRLYRSDVGRALPVSCALKSIARLVGYIPVEVDRSAIHALSESQLSAYVASDAALTRQLVLRRRPAIDPQLLRLVQVPRLSTMP